MICDWCISIRFVCFCLSRFIDCDRNYDWRQRKTQLWRRLLHFRVRMFVKSAVIACHSVQKEIIKEVKKYSYRLSCCVNCLVASGSKAAGLRQFSKVRSLKRDFVDRCKFHCCCTLLQLCMVCYHIEIWVLCKLLNEKMWEFSLKRSDRLGATVR